MRVYVCVRVRVRVRVRLNVRARVRVRLRGCVRVYVRVHVHVPLPLPLLAPVPVPMLVPVHERARACARARGYIYDMYDLFTHTCHEQDLDMGIVILKSWSQLPDFLLSVSPQETKTRGDHVRGRYAAVKAALQRHLLSAVCQLKGQLSVGRIS